MRYGRAFKKIYSQMETNVHEEADADVYMARMNYDGDVSKDEVKKMLKQDIKDILSRIK